MQFYWSFGKYNTKEKGNTGDQIIAPDYRLNVINWKCNSKIHTVYIHSHISKIQVQFGFKYCELFFDTYNIALLKVGIVLSEGFMVALHG